MPRDQARDFANATPTSSEPTRPGPLRDRDRAEIREADDLRLLERLLDDAADVAHVLARRQLRHDAAPLAMDVGLRRDDVREERHGRAASPVSARTAAAVSSHDVSIGENRSVHGVTPSVWNARCSDSV